MRTSLLILFVSILTAGYAQSPALPANFKASFKNKGIDKRYLLNAFLQGPFVQADFNGDGTEDLAILVIEKSTKKKGILVMHGKTNQYYVFGAGTKSGSGSDNFKWADKWTIYKKKTALEKVFNKENGDLVAEREVRLSRPAILIEGVQEGAIRGGGLIYWNDNKYVWINQGE